MLPRFRSFLSFEVVEPVGAEALHAWLQAGLPWFSRVAEHTDKLALSGADLEEWGLLRSERDFVGARGLA